MISLVSNSGHRYNFFLIFLIYILNLLNCILLNGNDSLWVLANDTENILVVMYTLVQIN